MTTADHEGGMTSGEGSESSSSPIILDGKLSVNGSRIVTQLNLISSNAKIEQVMQKNTLNATVSSRISSLATCPFLDSLILVKKDKDAYNYIEIFGNKTLNV